MTLLERLKYQVYTEIDVYINLIHENVFEDNPHKQGIEEFIHKTVIRRFNILRDIITKYEEEEAAKTDK